MASRARNLANLLGGGSATIPVESIPEGVGGAAPVANDAALPTTGNSIGDLKITSDKKALHIWNGTKWERVQHGFNVSPRFVTLPPSTLSLNASGLTSTISAEAVDETGFPITYDWDGFSDSTVYAASSLPNQITNVTESAGVFTLTPSTNTSHAGSFTFRTKASDGAQVSIANTVVGLTFSVDITTSGVTFNSDGTNSFDFTDALTSTTGARFSSNLQTGKYYFEVVMGSLMTAAASLPLSVGLVDASVTSAGYNYNEWRGLQTWTGNYYPSGSSSPALGVCNVTGDVIMIAYDTSTREVWFGVNGTWEKNPASDSGYVIGNTNTTAFKVMLGSSSGVSRRYNGTFNLGSNLNYAVPTGFIAH